MLYLPRTDFTWETNLACTHSLILSLSFSLGVSHLFDSLNLSFLKISTIIISSNYRNLQFKYRKLLYLQISLQQPKQKDKRGELKIASVSCTTSSSFMCRMPELRFSSLQLQPASLHVRQCASRTCIFSVH